MHGSVKLSVKIDYACRVLINLARRQSVGELAHIGELAEAEAVPPNYLVQILGELREGGIINSRRGKQGGYSLARSPETISLYDIVTLVDGELLEFNQGGQGRSAGRVTAAWSEVRAALEAATRALTLDKLAAQGGGPMYFI